MAVLLGDSSDANFPLTTSSYSASAGELRYPVTSAAAGTITSLWVRINTTAPTNWRLLIRNSADQIIAQGVITAGDNSTRNVSVTPVNISAGATYWLCFSLPSGSVRPYQNSTTNIVQQDISSTYAAPESTYVSDSTISGLRQFQMWAEGDLILPQSITSLTAPLVMGGLYTINTSGFANGESILSFGGVNSAHTLSGGSATASLPAFSDGLLCPFLPATGATITETQGSLTATISRNISVQSGWDVLRNDTNIPSTFSGIVLGDGAHIGQQFVNAANPLTTSDTAYFPTLYGLKIHPSGYVEINSLEHETDPVPSLPYTTEFYVHRASDGRMYKHGLTVNGDGSGAPGDATVHFLSANFLSCAFLSCSFLASS